MFWKAKSDPDENLEFERRLLEGLARAGVNNQPYTLVACVPQQLPGEDNSDLVPRAAEHVSTIVRDNDVVGTLDGEIITIGLPDSSPNAARVAASRLQGDLHKHSIGVRNILWETGYASFPEDADNSSDLLLTAVERAMTRRRRLGA